MGHIHGPVKLAEKAGASDHWRCGLDRRCGVPAQNLFSSLIRSIGGRRNSIGLDEQPRNENVSLTARVGRELYWIAMFGRAYSMSEMAAVRSRKRTIRPRSADYAIQGFLYQFNKTLLEILSAAWDDEVRIEGVIEDIEVVAPTGLTAIQCKYHEAQSAFVPSAVYRPLLQMLIHFLEHRSKNINYVLYAYFPDLAPGGPSPITTSDLESALRSANEGLKPLIQQVGQVDSSDLEEFLSRFRMELGPKFDELVYQVYEALKLAGIAEEDVETLAYPNAINIIANLSINHSADQRKITKSQLVQNLLGIKKTAVSRWTLALRTRKQILKARRSQLKPNLDKNVRLRYFIIDPSGLEDFETGIVTFICDFLDKYHFKPAHLQTPLFCLDTNEDVFDNIRARLFQKGIICTDGFIGSHFYPTYFFREPIRNHSKGVSHVEFRLRLLRWTDMSRDLLDSVRCDDLFLLGTDDLRGLNVQDVNVEILEGANLKEISYMLGVSNTYD